MNKEDHKRNKPLKNLLLKLESWIFKKKKEDFPEGPVVRNLPANAGNMDSISGPEDSTGSRATSPEHHNYWSPYALEPVVGNQRPLQWVARAPQL